MATVHKTQREDMALSTRVITAVADTKDCSVSELTPPLYNVIDPEALEMLFQSASKSAAADATVSFHYADCDVTVHGDGTVTVTVTDPDVQSAMSDD